jgi:hypothetical protein
MNFQQNQALNKQIQDTLNQIRTNEVLELVPLEPTTFNTLYSCLMNQQDKEHLLIWTR